MSATAGLKEFADGDTALFNGSLMINLNSEEDFEAEFRRLLTEDGVLSTDGTFTEDFNTTPALLQADSSDDFYASSSVDTMTTTITSISPTMKFEEDPLSAILNKQQPPKPMEIKKKRGRPSNLKFKSMEYFEEQSRLQSSLKILKPREDYKNSATVIPSQLHMRDRRSEDDKYSPVWIRGRGVDREGLCPLCNPSVWLKIKQSAYWYHMNFYHGISAATGRPYKHPINYRFSYDEKSCKRVVEGHCGTCLQWIHLAADFEGIESTESIEEHLHFTVWYKHAQKCHYRAKEFQIPSYFS